MIQTFQIFFPIEKSFPELGERSSQKMLPNVALFAFQPTNPASNFVNLLYNIPLWKRHIDFVWKS